MVNFRKTTFYILGDIFKLSQFAKWIKQNELRGDDKITAAKFELTMIHDTQRSFVPSYNTTRSNYVAPYNDVHNLVVSHYNSTGPSHAGRGARHNNYSIDNRKRNAAANSAQRQHTQTNTNNNDMSIYGPAGNYNNIQDSDGRGRLADNRNNFATNSYGSAQRAQSIRNNNDMSIYGHGHDHNNNESPAGGGGWGQNNNNNSSWGSGQSDSIRESNQNRVTFENRPPQRNNPYGRNRNPGRGRGRGRGRSALKNAAKSDNVPVPNAEPASVHNERNASLLDTGTNGATESDKLPTESVATNEALNANNDNDATTSNTLEDNKDNLTENKEEANVSPTSKNDNTETSIDTKVSDTNQKTDMNETQLDDDLDTKMPALPTQNSDKEQNSETTKPKDSVNNYSTTDNVPVFQDKVLLEKEKHFKIMKMLYSNGINQLRSICRLAYENGDKDYMEYLHSTHRCTYSIYNHCSCERWVSTPPITCSVQGCGKQVHKTCFYKMYSFYSGANKDNVTKLIDDSYIHGNETVTNENFMYAFPMHEQVKPFQLETFYCADHLEDKTETSQQMEMINVPDIRSYINSFLTMKKDSVTSDDNTTLSKLTIKEINLMVAINKREVRPIDNLIYWSIIMPPASRKYEIFAEYTGNQEYKYRTNSKECVNDDFLSDERYLKIKNIATCAAVDYITKNTDLFVEPDESNNNNASNNDDELEYDSCGSNDHMFVGGDVKLQRKETIEDYTNVALKARFTFSESLPLCPCHEKNEYFYKMHWVQTPHTWCPSRNTSFRTTEGLVDHLKNYKDTCKWHDIYYNFFKVFEEELSKEKR